MYLAIQLKYGDADHRYNKKLLSGQFILDPILASEIIATGDFIVYKLDSLQEVKDIEVITREIL